MCPKVAQVWSTVVVSSGRRISVCQQVNTTFPRRPWCGCILIHRVVGVSDSLCLACCAPSCRECKTSARCGWCGEQGHTHIVCSKAACACLYCSGTHGSPQCPAAKFKLVLRSPAEEKTEGKRAAGRPDAPFRPAAGSYAAAVVGAASEQKAAVPLDFMAQMTTMFDSIQAAAKAQSEAQERRFTEFLKTMQTVHDANVARTERMVDKILAVLTRDRPNAGHSLTDSPRRKRSRSHVDDRGHEQTRVGKNSSDLHDPQYRDDDLSPFSSRASSPRPAPIAHDRKSHSSVTADPVQAPSVQPLFTFSPVQATAAQPLPAVTPSVPQTSLPSLSFSAPAPTFVTPNPFASLTSPSDRPVTPPQGRQPMQTSPGKTPSPSKTRLAQGTRLTQGTRQASAAGKNLAKSTFAPAGRASILKNAASS